MIRLLILTAGVILLLHRPAYAYLDPGTASIILQVVVGAVAGLMYGNLDSVALGDVTRSHA